MSQEQKNDASSEETKEGLWTPPEKLDTSTQRMAWTLFLETWKREGGCIDQPAEAVHSHAAATYERCLVAAKAVRGCEHKAGGQ